MVDTVLVSFVLVAIGISIAVIVSAHYGRASGALYYVMWIVIAAVVILATVTILRHTVFSGGDTLKELRQEARS